MGRVEVAALPAPSPCGLAHRGARRWGSSAGSGGNSVRGDRGVFVPAEAAAEDPTMAGRPRTGNWRTGTKTPYAATPRGGPLRKFGSSGMMVADDG